MKKIVMIAALILTSSSIFGVEWERYDLTESGTEEKGETKIISLTDADGNALTVSYTEEITDAHAKIIAKLNHDFRTWESMKIGEMHFSIHNGTIEILINPSEYMYKNVNYLEYLSAGIYFSFSDSLYYNFRIAVDRVFVVIKGTYTDEASFNDKIMTAIEDPRGYMKRRDPEYLLEQVEALQADQYRTKMALIASIRRKPMEAALVNKIVEIKKANPTYTSKEIAEALKEEDIRVSTTDVKIVLSVFFNEFE